MKPTRQREVILDVLQLAARPLTREELLAEGRKVLPRLGSATVDRAIRNMTASFEVIGVEFPGQPRRYELPATHEHPHFICRECERVFDIPVKMQLPEVKAPHGFLVMGGEIIYSGTCRECLQKRK
jgi:Fur family ferric uptake transcriptional regulator